MLRPLCLLLLVPALLQPAVPADPAAEVLAFEAAACAAYQRNDAHAIDTLVADGSALTDRHGRIVTKTADLSAARNHDVEFREFRDVDMTVTMFGTTAIVRGRTLVRGQARSGEAVAVDVRFTDTVVRLGGRWQLVAGHVSRIPGS